MTFGQRLKHLMTERNITQRQLSRELNIAVSTLNGYANDYREPDYVTLALLSSYFEVSSDYLLGLSNIPKLSNTPLDEGTYTMLHYYNQLSSEMKQLLIEQAKLLTQHDIFDKENRKNGTNR